MQNIASIAKLAIQILSVLLLATIMGNKNRNTNTNTNNNNNNQQQNNTNNNNNNNNVFILVMALPIGSDSSGSGSSSSSSVGGINNNDDDISYKDNTDILILSDINNSNSNSNSNSDSNINLSDVSGIVNSDIEDFDMENSETNGFLNEMIKNNDKRKSINSKSSGTSSSSNSSGNRSSSSSIKKNYTSISNNNSNNKNSFNNNNNQNDKPNRINNIKRSIKSASEDLNIELTTIGYNPLNDNIENNFSTIESKDTNINVVADGDDIIDDDDDDENNDDDTDDDEQNIIFKDELIRLGVSSNKNSESLNIDSQNITTSSKLSIDDNDNNNNNKNSNINNNNNNKNLLPLNIVIDKPTSTSLSSTTTNVTQHNNLANTGILNGPSTILQLDRINSTQQNIINSSSLSIPSTNFLNDNNNSLKSSLTFQHNNNNSSSSLSSTSNLILLSKTSYVPANIQQQQQQNIPIENNLIALNAANKENVASNIATGIQNINGIQTDSNFNIRNNNNNDGTIVKTYLGMQSNITTTKLLSSSSLLSSTSSQQQQQHTSDKLLSSSLTAASALDLTSGDKKLGHSPILSSNINVNNIIEIGKTVENNSNSDSTSKHNHHAGVGINNSGHSGVVSSFSEAISSKLTLPKPQKTDAPMLNYIFDTYSAANKHHHHDQRYGPHFEDKREGNVTNITVQAGSTIHLNCRISLLQDKTVSWVKRNINDDDEALELLTVGGHTYTGDSRFTIDFQYPSNWRLKISNVRKSDEGQYECQISTHPPRVIQINLHVNAPKVIIVDEYGIPLQEKYYEIDSTLQLSCIVRNVVMSASAVFWSHGDQILNYDLTRGGVSVKTELMDDGANSTLFIAKINKSDSGNYTCSINQFHDYSIMVHILNGESFAELHHGNSSRLTSTVGIILYIVLLIFLLQFHQRNKIFLIIR